MRKSQFFKHIKELNINELQQELLSLYDKVPEVKKYYSMELGDEKERTKLYVKAKKEIAAKYATKSYRKPRRPRIQKVNKILSEMKKSSIFDHEMIDLYLYDVETALLFSIQYHFFSKVLSNHLQSIFKKAILLIQGQQLQDMFHERCQQIVARTSLVPEIHWEIKSIYNSGFEQ